MQGCAFETLEGMDMPKDYHSDFVSTFSFDSEFIYWNIYWFGQKVHLCFPYGKMKTDYLANPVL